MQFKKYLEKIKQTPNAFAVRHKLSAATVWRAANGKALRPNNAQKISFIAGGAVTLRELLFPGQGEQNKGRGADSSQE